jgi:hypothetical protein
MLPDRNLREMLLQRRIARPYTGVKTREAVTQLGWTVLPEQPRNAGLGPSDFDLLGPLNDAAHGGKFESDDDVVSAIRTLAAASSGHGIVGYRSVIHDLFTRRRKGIELHG